MWPHPHCYLPQGTGSCASYRKNVQTIFPSHVLCEGIFWYATQCRQEENIFDYLNVRKRERDAVQFSFIVLNAISLES